GEIGFDESAVAERVGSRDDAGVGRVDRAAIAAVGQLPECLVADEVVRAIALADVDGRVQCVQAAAAAGRDVVDDADADQADLLRFAAAAGNEQSGTERGPVGDDRHVGQDELAAGDRADTAAE